MNLTVHDQEYHDCKDQFLQTFTPLVQLFHEQQLSKFTKQTAAKYRIVADAWIDYLYGYTDCLTFADIKISHLNNGFWNAVRHQELYDWDNKEARQN